MKNTYQNIQEWTKHHEASEPIKLELDRIKRAIEAEEVSQGDIMTLQGLTLYIDPSDTLLLEWAGVPENDEEEK